MEHQLSNLFGKKAGSPKKQRRLDFLLDGEPKKEIVEPVKAAVSKVEEEQVPAKNARDVDVGGSKRLQNRLQRRWSVLDLAMGVCALAGAPVFGILHKMRLR